MTINTCEANSIIACVDGSAHTHAVLHASMWASQQLQCPIGLLHAHDINKNKKIGDYSGSIGMDSNETLLDTLSEEDAKANQELREQGKTLLKQCKEYIKEKKQLATFQPHIFKIHRHDSLKNCVKELQETDLKILVMGQDGTNKESEIGSQLEKVLRISVNPVLIVTKDFKTPKKVLIAFDNRTNSKAGIKWIKSHPLLANTEIHLVYVADDTTENQESLRLACSKLKQNGLTVVSKIIPGVAKKVLVDYQKEVGVDMLVMGAYGHSRLHEFFKGSTTDYMIKHNLNSILMMCFD